MADQLTVVDPDTLCDTHWTAYAACWGTPGVEPDWWWPADHHGAPSAATRRAAHICRHHCPVIPQCARYAREYPPRHPVVLGGEYYASRGRGLPRVVPLVVSDTLSRCPYCAGSRPVDGGGVDG